MAGEDEIIGDLAEASLVARAAEPELGKQAEDGHTHESACLNCGTLLVGSHCHACGQAAHVHKTLGAFFHDLLHGVFHFEGKIWRTLPLLVWRPGRLTREYIDGRRASYISPIALFLFSVFLMFAVLKSTLGGATISPGISVAIDGQRADIAELQAERATRIKSGKNTENVDAQIASEQEDLAVLEKVKSAGGVYDPAIIDDETSVKSNIPEIDKAIAKARANPDLIIYKLQTSAYKYSWMLIPLSVPFVWILFAWRRRFGLYDHTVFVTYSLCFMTLLVVAVSVIGLYAAPLAAMMAVFVPPLHMYRQLKGCYGLSRFSALWRTIALSIIAFTALLTFGITLIAMELA